MDERTSVKIFTGHNTFRNPESTKILPSSCIVYQMFVFCLYANYAYLLYIYYDVFNFYCLWCKQSEYIYEMFCVSVIYQQFV